ncbi:MAG: hypothetical protein ABSD62_06600 [Candidatus Limnocylindrales bacterium]|jgi:hypothetical protein
MNDSLDPTIDFEVEGRLRRYAAGDAPVPARLYRFVAEIAGEAAPIATGPVRLERVRRGQIGRRSGGRALLVGLAAAAVIAVTATALLIAVRPNTHGPATAAATAPGGWPWQGLEWQKITATSFARGSDGFPGLQVQSWHGRLYTNVFGIWQSDDSIHWNRVSEVASGTQLWATSDALVSVSYGCYTGTTCELWNLTVQYSTDGVTWQQGSLADFWLEGVAGNGERVVLMLGSPAKGHEAYRSAVPYVSTDGATWTAASVPADMAAAIDTTISTTREGFLVSGLVPDKSSETIEDGVRGFHRAWSSPDGLTWTRTDLPPIDTSSPWLVQVQRGSAGDEIGGWHSADGSHWTTDETAGGTRAMQSNGSVVVGYGDDGALYATIGDGRWYRLASTGDFSGTPEEGKWAVVPTGLLYFDDVDVYYGRAVGSGTQFQTAPAS